MLLEFASDCFSGARRLLNRSPVRGIGDTEHFDVDSLEREKKNDVFKI